MDHRLSRGTVKPLITEHKIKAASLQGTLHGTLLSVESESAPVVLIIPGSGPIDRDGNAQPDLGASPLRLVAEGLAAKNISSIRIDKRGMYESAGAAEHGDKVTVDDYAVDARSWVETLKRRSDDSRVWILGHSEGGLVALTAALSCDDICGLVLVSTPGRKISEVLREQLLANPANNPVLAQALKALQALDAGRYVDDSQLHPALLPLFRASIQDYLIDLMKVDPVGLIAGYDKPVLVVQGTRDLQTSIEDAALLTRANPLVVPQIISGMNHVLKHIESDSAEENIRAYVDPDLPLAEGLIDSICAFIQENS
ncbi:alpha/beta hydrolase [Klebsiella sp. 2680]|uniref:alpha/beta hydrolase n=1 Tax=Klebsiella sp. 2680 TaxID=2018037 RepID=UPI00115A91C9|nr:alpha/beta fold hydrolase [Klebsiella sp. 2680]